MLAVPQDLEAEIDERITHYPVSKRSAVLPVLHHLQHHFGYISEQAVEWTAAKLGLEPIKVLEVVTFYPGFRQEAPGTYHIRVCRTVPVSPITIPLPSAPTGNTASSSPSASPVAASVRSAWSTMISTRPSPTSTASSNNIPES